LHLLAALGVGMGIGLLLLRDPELALGLRSLRTISDYCPCNQAMSEVEPGLDLASLEMLVGERLQAVDAQGRLRLVVDAVGEDRQLWLGQRLVVDCWRPDALHARRGVIRSYVIELDGAGQVRSVQAEGLDFYGCDGETGPIGQRGEASDRRS
jgi:hypothetical protein